MDQLLKNKEFKAKMTSLSPGVKQWFIESLIDLFEQESEYVIDVLEDCRYELGHTAKVYVEEAEHLRATSRMLEDRRDDGSGDHQQRSSSRASSLSQPLRLPLISSERSFIAGGQPRLRPELRGRQRTCTSDNFRSASSLSVPEAARPQSGSGLLISSSSSSSSPSSSAAAAVISSARATRSQPVSPSYRPGSKTIEEETKALLQSMTDAESQKERERERQQDRLERIRRQKKFLAEDRTEQAMKLLEKALEMDRVLAQNRDRQGQMLQNKLQDLKQRRNRIQSSHAEAQDTT